MKVTYNVTWTPEMLAEIGKPRVSHYTAQELKEAIENCTRDLADSVMKHEPVSVIEGKRESLANLWGWLEEAAKESK